MPVGDEVLGRVIDALGNPIDGLGKCFPSAELVAAASKGHKERVKSLLNQMADPNSSDSSMTALQRACLERHPDVASQLLLARRGECD